MKLNENTIKTLEAKLAESSDEQIERIKLLIENNSEVSDDVKEALLKVISDFIAGKEEATKETEESTEEVEENSTEDSAPADLVQALEIPGMKEYIDSANKEAFDKGYAEANALSSVEKVETTSEKVEVSNEDSENDNTPSEDVKKVLIDSIIQSATALRKPEIDLEKVSESQDKYREELEGKDHEDLKSIYSDLAKSMVDSFVNAPTESLPQEAISEDAPEGLEDKENDADKSDAYKILKGYFNSKTDKQGDK
tara:strand:+ start:3018 stop:3779 length:762 start_codon:yes stop_codon:yes gene_type:complete